MLSSKDRQGAHFTTVVGTAALIALVTLSLQVSAQKTNPLPPRERYARVVLPLLRQYCFACHSAQVKKGGLDLQRFATEADLRKDLKPWLGVLEQLHAGQMPPAGLPQPTPAEKNQLTNWVRGFLDGEARAQANDPGEVPLRRLSNAEYDNTIQALTGVALQPAREFPADGAAGEGFTNASEALTDISPTLLGKYLNAAKEVAAHAVLVPDGFRFSPNKTRRDWTNESIARLQQFYARFATDEGQLPLQPYLAATITHRDALQAGKQTLAQVAAAEHLNARYLGILYQALTRPSSSLPLRQVQEHWRQADLRALPALLAEIKEGQSALWRTVRVSNYLQIVEGKHLQSATRQEASDPACLPSVPLRLALKPPLDQKEVVLSLSTRDFSPVPPGARVVWQRPRLEAAGKPTLLLRDYSQFGPAFEVDPPSVFRNAALYLQAALETNTSVEATAAKHQLNAAFLKRWVALLDLSKRNALVIPTAPLTLLNETLQQPNAPAIQGWRRAGMELPALLTNASDTEAHIPGTAAAHHVVVHPSPQQFVGVVWKSPLAGTVRVSARITHAHPSCGNGVAWWLEHRSGGQSILLGEATIALGKEARPAAKTITVQKGDQLLLAVDANKGDHTCDLTDIALTVAELDSKTPRIWNLATEIADRVVEGNPHADRWGNKDTWNFVLGPTRAVGASPEPTIPPDSLLGRWRVAALSPARLAEASHLALEIQALLSGSRPVAEKSPDQLLYDHLVPLESPLLQGVDVVGLGRPLPRTAPFGPRPELFGQNGNRESLVTEANSTLEIRLPAALLRQYELVVEGTLDTPPGSRAVQFQVATDRQWKNPNAVVSSPTSTGYQALLQGNAEFRRVFPLFLCFPRVIPNDEVVSLKMFHREDEPLKQLFLTPTEEKTLERLWAEHRLISRQSAEENDYLPQFIGFVTQDGTKEALAFFKSLTPSFQERAALLAKEESAAIPKQLDALEAFMAKAYRRPCTAKERTDLRALYQVSRQKGISHEDTFRALLARILVAPAFLFRLEQAPAGKVGPITDLELATRLSYFLWSGPPDAELTRLATTGRLHDPKVLDKQVDRMLKDERLRALAIEFGTQWVHVRNFDSLNEKNEKLFPTFDASLRKAIYEESIQFFQDLFRSDRAVTQLLDADYTFLNEALAKHYGIPNVSGQQWRLVRGVKKYGRGGLLGLASIQAKQAGASRTSPVLRGNWVLETLLGEKLPPPPANVPRLPEEEGGADKLTMRQLVEKHTRVPACAGCHQRIDPLGFALERYDPIGRLRSKDLGGLPVDAKARLKDGAQFEGIDGLRTYLLTQKRDVVVRVFCRRLLGYALGRSVTLSDTKLLNEMVAALNTHQGRLSAAVHTIVQSPQFRMRRGREF